MKVSIQNKDFDLNAECQKLLQSQTQAGALVSFVGVVRASGNVSEEYSLELEHYSGMTEKVITEMVELAIKRFSLLDATVIHRIGCLNVGAQIVMVAVVSSHRRAAFEGCEFLMDYLKTQAPFWKKENDGKQSGWVDARESDDQALKRWGISSQNVSK